ncbi:MAG TPA: nucleotide exchange factor GrpE [Firmicutes bacterium]|nr:nucleotide exchange factor GrpE [Bacillota bacterium]
MTEDSLHLPDKEEEKKENSSSEPSLDGGETNGVTSGLATELQTRVEELEQENKELTARLLRLQADFDNYRKRMRAEKETLEENANFNFIKKLLPVMDNLDRASSSSTEAKEAIAEGLALISKQFMGILEKEGVTPMDCQGKPFDPYYHEAVTQENSPDHAPGTVIEEIQKGYLMKGKVLRISMCRVSGE